MRGQDSGNRLDRLMRLQKRISKEQNNTLMGKTLKTIVEGVNVGRTYRDAPEIDGKVFIKNSKSLKPGEIIKLRITGSKTYDLIGHPT